MRSGHYSRGNVAASVFFSRHDQLNNRNAMRQKSVSGWKRHLSMNFAVRAVLVITVVCCGVSPAAGSRMARVTFPSTLTVGATKLSLNGEALEMSSVKSNNSYAAGLYLERRCHNPSVILTTPGLKLLQITFLSPLSASDLREDWRRGILNNCVSPCRVSPNLLSHFLTNLQSVRSGDVITILFSPYGLHVDLNGKSIDRIASIQFTEFMLAAFIGPRPINVGIDQRLLGN